MLAALIMAGGKGTRFWPMSTEEKPKQFLNLIGENTMLQSTVNRLRELINLEHIFVCTSNSYVHLVHEQLPELPEKNIIVEPVGRNTAPCILLSTLYIKEMCGECEIVVVPSDHIINDNSKFLNILMAADNFIQLNQESIVTIGIEPNRPETGYGYINFGDEVALINQQSVKKVKKFVEKPDFQTANTYLKEGTYLWNAGMFIFNGKFMLKQFKELCSSMYAILTSLPSIYDDNYFKELEKKYQKCDSISVDYAIMEKSQNINVIPGNIGWDDIGSWVALERYIKKDENNNVVKGKINAINSNNNVVYSTGKDVILLDVDNICVIETGDKIVICNKESMAHIHELRGKN